MLTKEHTSNLIEITKHYNDAYNKLEELEVILKKTSIAIEESSVELSDIRQEEDVYLDKIAKDLKMEKDEVSALILSYFKDLK
jgi:hypothetical protein